MDYSVKGPPGEKRETVRDWETSKETREAAGTRLWKTEAMRRRRCIQARCRRKNL